MARCRLRHRSLYRLAKDTRVEVLTDEGSFVFKFRAGFVTNFRSGGVAVDCFVDQVGDEKKALCYLVHDAIYTPCAALGMEHPISRIKGDQLLRAALLYCLPALRLQSRMPTATNLRPGK